MKTKKQVETDGPEPDVADVQIPSSAPESSEPAPERPGRVRKPPACAHKGQGRFALLARLRDLSSVTYSDGTPTTTIGYDRRGRQGEVGRNGITTTLTYGRIPMLLEIIGDFAGLRSPPEAKRGYGFDPPSARSRRV